ncbi:MAG: hypothetical protein IPG48_12465 [Saprospiraceae bacterium]|nr:hypothetical protein [Saprospiraceae bacterium]MBK7697527.1 hypothetical protein [Saprospiraceae bacterium]
MQKYFFIFFFLIVACSYSYAQDESEKPVDGSIIVFGGGMGLNIPLADLKERYGSNLNFSVGGDYILANNWIFSTEFMYFFGDKVKEDVLASYRTSNGTLLGDDEQLADVFLKQRGVFLGLGFGKLLPLHKGSRSGLKLMVHGGILQHQIKFTDERNSFAQIRAGRQIGYDRLSRGFSLKETIAYKNLSKDRRLNFEFALDFIQGFTSEIRPVNYDTGLPSIGSRFDMMIGARLIWNLPFYQGSQETIYY